MENLSQHELKSELDKRLFVLSRFGGTNTDWFENSTINDEAYWQELGNFLVENGCRLLVLDNMKALMGDKVAQPDAVQKVFDWMRKLGEAGICVVYILHKDEDAPKTSRDKNKGASTFREMARTILNNISSPEILENKQSPDPVRVIAKKDGLTCGLQFPTCKNAPILENKTIWLFLPFDSGNWETICITDSDGSELDLQDLNFSPDRKTLGEKDISENSCINKADEVIKELSKLSGRTRQVYDAMKTFPNAECSIGELKEKFKGKKGMGGDTIRNNYLKKLIDAKLVEELGDSPRSRRYRIIHN